MRKKDIMTMTVEELRRLSVVNQVIGNVMTQKDAAKMIGISYRQTKRLVARTKKEGNAGIIHKSRGKQGNRMIAEGIRNKAMKLYKEKYWDFTPTLASEKLDERDGISISHETLRLWLLGEGKHEWQRKARPHRQWRQRKDYFGEMAQMDGSHHAWLEERGPWLVFMGYIDDATGITIGRFYDYEGILYLLWIA